MISVIIPAHDRAALLARALDSVFAQTLPPGEVIVVDDGSADETPDLLARLRAAAPLPFLALRQENRGAAAARNAGIRAARGEILAFLDDDDQWRPDKLEKQARAMARRPDILIAHTREIWYRNGLRVNQKKKHDPPDGDIFVRSLSMCVVGMSTVMARRAFFERFGGFDESFPCCEDYELWLRAARDAPFLLVPEALTVKDGGRADQLSVIHRLGMDKYRIRALRKLIDSGGLSAEQDAAARRELARKCAIYGNGCLKHGREAEGREYLDLARRYCPDGQETICLERFNFHFSNRPRSGPLQGPLPEGAVAEGDWGSNGPAGNRPGGLLPPAASRPPPSKREAWSVPLRGKK